jgi:uncharacterized protein (UPF0333 family)
MVFGSGVLWKGFVLLVLVLIFGGLFYYYNSEVNSSDIVEDIGFRVDSVLLKFVIKQGDSIKNQIVVTNKGERKDFSVYIRDLGIPFKINESEFVLNTGEKKTLDIVFDSVKDNLDEIDAGVYVGNLVVFSGGFEKVVPVILEVESRDVLFVTNLEVRPDCKNVISGGSTCTGIRVFNLNDTNKHEVEMNYYVRDLFGERLIFDSEKIVVGSEAFIEKSFALGDDIENGKYVFVVETRVEGSVSTGSYLFNVIEKKDEGQGSNSLTYIFSVVVIVLLIGIFFIVFFISKERDKLFDELKRVHRRELKFAEDKISAKRKVYVSRVKSREEKKKIEDEFKRAKRKVLGKIKKKQKEQKKELKRIKRKGKVSEAEKKIKEWRNKGFDVDSALISKKESSGGVDKRLNEWRKKGYDTGVLG